MTGMGRALMGTGYGTGDKRAIEAAQQAISSPLLEDVSINGATGILLNITGGPDLTLAEMNEACSLIAEAADPGGEHHLRLGHRRARGRRGPHHRHRDRLQRARARAAGAGRGRDGTARARPRGPDGAADAGVRGDGAGADHDGAAAAAADEPVGTDVDPTARGGYARAGAARPATAARPSTSTSSTRAWREVPPAAMGAVPTGAAAERARVDAVRAAGTSGVRAGPQAANTAPAGAGRRSSQMQSPRPADELGVEESEFDKPTYLRRGLYAPE